jgi:hypothetical protein
MHFTDERGRTLHATGCPQPPAQRFDAVASELGIPAGAWSHPTGERLDLHWIHFNQRAG